jgi:hypothetical protein
MVGCPVIDPRTDREAFADLCRVAAGALGDGNPALTAILEKDYWVTRVLSAVAEGHADHVVLKGGTSLSKGWQLTQRFSEDIDLAVDPGQRGEAARDSLLKSIAQVVSDRCALPPAVRNSGKGVHRAVAYTFPAIWSGGELVPPSVLLEMGTRSAFVPVATLRLETMLAHAVPAAAAELPACDLPVLRAERTLVEKLFVIHGAVVRHLHAPERAPLARLGRHYYDVARLLGDEVVRASVGTADFWEMARDHDERGSREFPKHVGPPALNFGASPGLFPDEATRAELAREYERDRDLFFGTSPSFDRVLASLRAVRSLLTP